MRIIGLHVIALIGMVLGLFKDGGRRLRITNANFLILYSTRVVKKLMGGRCFYTKKTSLHYTRGIKSKGSTNGGAYLRSLTPG